MDRGDLIKIQKEMHAEGIKKKSKRKACKRTQKGHKIPKEQKCKMAWE